MSDIRTTALSALDGQRLPRGTGRLAQRALDAVVAREQDLFAQIVETAVGYGVSRSTAHSKLVALGMTAPTPEPRHRADVDLPARVERIAETVENLLQFARSKGYRGF
jgi:hypothetical protein